MSAVRPEIELSPLLPSKEIEGFLARQDQRRQQQAADLEQRLDAGELVCPRCETNRLIADPQGIDGPLLFCPDLSGCGFREP